MADDIVIRLRYAARACNHGFPNGAGDSFPDPTYCGGCLRLNDAADEIERLRAEVRRVPLGHITTLCELEVASEEIERLRAAGDALVGALEPFGGVIPPMSSILDNIEKAIDIWKEVRRV